MGFGKYTKEERKIVYKISDLMSKIVYHKHKLTELCLKQIDLIASLGGKYEQKK